MPKIVEVLFYDGAEEKISRLGLSPLIEEIKTVLQSFHPYILEEKNRNSGGVLRKMIDVSFKKAEGWTQTASGDVDWVKCRIVNGAQVCVGVEIQVSARSDLIIRDIVHLRSQMIEGAIDVGVLVLPSDRLSYYLTDRAPSMADGKRIIGEMRADDLPLVLIAIQHDHAGREPLPKMVTKQSKTRPTQ